MCQALVHELACTVTIAVNHPQSWIELQPHILGTQATVERRFPEPALEKIGVAQQVGSSIHRVVGRHIPHIASCFWRRDGRDVAVKVLPGMAWADDLPMQRFLREARLHARVKHSNVVSIHTAGEADGLSYYVMDFVPSETLAERLVRYKIPQSFEYVSEPLRDDAGKVQRPALRDRWIATTMACSRARQID
jgi:serine/threonine protein kinase